MTRCIKSYIPSCFQPWWVREQGGDEVKMTLRKAAATHKQNPTKRALLLPRPRSGCRPSRTITGDPPPPPPTGKPSPIFEMRQPTHHLHHRRGADRDPLEVPRVVCPWGGLAQFLELRDVEGVPSVGRCDRRRGVGVARFVRHRLVSCREPKDADSGISGNGLCGRGNRCFFLQLTDGTNRLLDELNGKTSFFRNHIFPDHGQLAGSLLYLPAISVSSRGRQ